MDSDDLFESDDSCTFELNVISEFRQLGLEEFNNLVNEAIINDKIKDVSVLAYHVFSNILVNCKNFSNEYQALLVLSSCIRRLKQVNKFSSIIFADCVLNDCLEPSLEVVWWLQKHEIMYMAEFRHILLHMNIPVALLNILKCNEDNSMFISKNIVQDILVETIRGCHRPNVSIYNLSISADWTQFCMNIINQLVDHIFTDVVNEIGDESVNLLSLIVNAAKHLPSIVIKLFFKSILTKFLTHNTTEYNVYSAYMYQDLWASQHISSHLKVVYEEIFNRFCSLSTIVDVMEEYDSNINWKYTLVAIGICTKISTNGMTHAKDIALQFFNSSLKGGKKDEFVKGLLIIRQACVEDKTLPYKLWYAQTFGVRNEYKATHHVPFFKFFIRCLTELIPYESKTNLKVHIEQVLFIPTKCNTIMHDYKNMCRARLRELEKSQTIIMQSGEVVVLQMIEETAMLNKICRLLYYVITNHYTSFCNIVIPEVLQPNPICKKVKELLLMQNYLNEDLIQSSSNLIINKNFDEDDVFVQLN